MLYLGDSAVVINDNVIVELTSLEYNECQKDKIKNNLTLNLFHSST